MSTVENADSPRTQSVPGREGPPPRPQSSADRNGADGTGARLLDLLETLWAAREVDRLEMELLHRGEGFFHVGGAGHEASAALAAHLRPDDWLHLHYRDKALILARGFPARAFFDALVCNAESFSAGRQMCAHPSSARLRLLSLPGPVGNGALQAVGVAHESARSEPSGDTVTVCSLGDGTTQQGEVLEAVAEAARHRLRVLFLIGDNRYAISTRTAGRTFFDLPDGPADRFHGVPIERLEGTDVPACDRGFSRIVGRMRREGGPAIVVMRVERLTHHTNADDERVYRDPAEREEVRRNADPVARLEATLLERGADPAELGRRRGALRERLRQEAEAALGVTDPEPASAAVAPYPTGFPERDELPPTGASRTLLEALREALGARLATEPRATLTGQDIEDPKGDVFGVTRGLSTRFPGRVLNGPLSESTIVGVGVGRALAGGRPVGFVQFADFLPLAFNQVATELATIHWRTVGEWEAPLVLMAPCGGYRPGLGPFHANTHDGTFAHVPGLDVFLPSNAADGAGLLNAAFRSGRPTLFLYPKVLLNDPAAAADVDPARAFVRPGTARTVVEGDQLTFVAWGATVPLCRRASELLARAGIAAGVLDLRTLAPWDEAGVLAAARRSLRLVVVHEDNHTGGFGAEVVATVAEKAGVPVAVRRVTRADTHIPCHYGNQLEVLPSLRRILDAAADLCGLRVEVEVDGAGAEASVHVLEAVGSSPADQTVQVNRWLVADGAAVAAGDLLAECEADKASFDLRSPVAGVLREPVAAGERVRVGDPLARIVLRDAPQRSRRIPREPRFRLVPVGRPPVTEPSVATVSPGSSDSPETRFRTAAAEIRLGVPAFVPGSVRLTNEALAARFPGRSAEDIVQRTGIVERRVCAPEEDVLTLAVAAARKALSEAALSPADLDGLYVATSTPLSVSPSLACRLQQALLGEGSAAAFPAVDLLAACSGYLYALQAAFDAAQAFPGGRFLVVTAEAMSRFVDPTDFDTAIVFGDAAAATVVYGDDTAGPAAGSGRIRLRRPRLGARGEDGRILSVGRLTMPGTCTPVSMDGLKVFQLAVRQMPAALQQACAEAGRTAAELDWIVPHQANGRILQAVQRQMGLPAERFLSNVAHHGNTSSCTLPIALAEMLRDGKSGTAGLCAFGGGFTFGAAVAILEPAKAEVSAG